MSDTDADHIEVPVVWVGVEDVSVLAANQLVVQFSAANEFILTFGQVSPPIFLGTEEQRLEQARMTTFVPIRPVARVGLNRQRLEELIKVLHENLENHDSVFDLEE